MDSVIEKFLEPRTLLELGAFGVMLFLYAFDRLSGQPKRDAAQSAAITALVKAFRDERKDDRQFMERTFDKLGAAIDKLSARIDDIANRG